MQEMFMKVNQESFLGKLFKRYKNSYLSYFLMYNFYYLSWALFSSFISVYLLDKGYKPSDVSLVVSMSFLTSMAVQPLIGVLSDKFNIKFINTVLFILAAIGGIYFLYASSLIEIMIGYSFVLTLLNGTNPVMERIATTSPYKYGSIRIWGTIGYALGSQCAGLIYDFISPSAMFIVFVFTMMICVFGMLGTSSNSESKEAKKQEGNLFKNVLMNKKYIYFLIIAALFAGVTNTVGTFTPAYFQSEELDVSVVSLIVSLAVIFEASIVLFSHKFMDKIANKALLIIAFGMILGLYMIYALNLPLPLQIIATFLVKHPAGMLFIMINLKIVNTLVDPKYQLTALAFVQTCRNLSSVIFQNIGGYLLNIATYQVLFLGCIVVVCFGLILVLAFKIPSGSDQKLFH